MSVELAITLVAPGGCARDVVVRWRGRVTVGDLLKAAGADGSAVRRQGAELPVGCVLDDAGLRPGDVLSLHEPGGSPVGGAPLARNDPATGWHLAVVGGPDAGALLPLAPGRYVIGRDPSCELVLNDAEVSRVHLAVEVSGASTAIDDLGSSNGTYVDGRAITSAVQLLAGQLVEAGTSRLQLVAGSPPDVELSPASDGCLDVRRPPRLQPPDTPVEVAWPVPPRRPEGRPIPLLAMLAPVVLGAGLWGFTRNAASLLFVALSPLMMVANVISDRYTGRRRYRRELAAYERQRAEVETRMAEASTVEGRRLRLAYPDPGTVLATAAGPRRRLWERRREAPDFLTVRLGLAELPSRIRVRTTEPAPQPAAVPDLPCTVPLAESGVLGVIGDADVSRAVARWILGQSAVASGPSDLRIVLLCGPDDEPVWGWTRWLPHTTADRLWPVSGLGTTPETVTARIRELVDLIEQRQRAVEESAFRGRPNWPWVLVMLERAYTLRSLPGIDVVLRDGPAVGVVAVCLETVERRLPLECRAVLVAGADGRGTLRRTGEAAVEEIMLDGAGPAWAGAVARALAPLRDPEGNAVAGAIPDSVRLVDLLGIDVADADAGSARLAAAWRLAGRSTSVAVGVGGDGPVRLDLVADGPHGLVGGTTGAGKSEFLQTLVASLAVANRPDALTFLLVDYKGEAAFRDCARLPHTVGLVTDLDGHLTERALRSLSAELRRREEILRRAAATDLAAYLERGQPAGPLPRLLIVIDEFAELAVDLPEFVTGLVSIARRGRSLGVHLILATQRPSGVVSPDIRANASLKVALRVTSPSESMEIIEAPEAARIQPATPGRAYLRVGSAAPVLFQSARVGGRAPRASRADEAVVTVVDVPWDQAGRQARRRWEEVEAANPDPDDTDLARLVAAASGAAELLDLPAVRPPWMPPVPQVLPLATLGSCASAPASGTGVVAAPFGLVDLPADQTQQRLCFDLETDEHLLVVGSPGRGRTSLLRTLCASLVAGNDPADLWLYAIDCGGGELRALASLPHAGAVVTRSETDRADRLLGRLHTEVVRRLDLLATAGFATVGEQRAAAAPADRLPYLVLLIDRWEAFLATFGTVDSGRLRETVENLAREGGAGGLRLVVTGDRSLLVGDLARAVDDRLYLGLTDRADLALAGLNVRDMPPQMPPGRALRHRDRAEVQVALVGDDPSGAGQATALAAVVSATIERAEAAPTPMPAAPGAPARAAPVGPAAATSAAPLAGHRPFRVDPLPTTVDLSAAARLSGWNPGPLWALAGVGGDDLAALGVDLAAHDPGFTVAGPRGSGRSTALVVLSESLLSGGNRVLALCPRPSPLRDLAGRPGVVAVLTGRDPPAEQVVTLLNTTPGPLAVVVDDAPDLTNTVVGDLLDQQATEGREKGHVLVIAGVAEDLRRPVRGFIPAVRQSRTGLLLCPQSHLDGDVLWVRLAPSAAFRGPAGRGVLVLDNRTTLVQVPQPAGD